MMTPEQLIDLTPAEFVEPLLPEYLESSRDREMHFGGTTVGKGKIEYRDIEIRLGNRPMAWQLRQLKASLGDEEPADLEVFDSFDVWLIAHAIAVISRDGSKPPEALGYTAEILDEGVLTIRTLPETNLIRTDAGKLTASAALRVNGELGVPEELKQGAKALYALTGDAKLAVSGAAEFMGSISFGCWTPRVVTMGACDNRCEWRFQKHDKPLSGTQLMFQTALVPSGIERLSVRLTGYALLHKSWLPCLSRVQTKPMVTEILPVGTHSPGMTASRPSA